MRERVCVTQRADMAGAAGAGGAADVKSKL